MMHTLYPVSHAVIHQTVSVFDIFILYLEYSVMLSIRFLENCGEIHRIYHVHHF